MIARAPQFAEALVVASVDLQSASTARLRDDAAAPARPERAARGERRRAASSAPSATAVEGLGGEIAELLDPEAEVYAALVLGVRDYVEKNGFEHVCLGLSGGIDSTLVAFVAVDALGADRVHVRRRCPRRYSSEGTRRDAEVLAENLGVALLEDPDRAGHGGLRRDARRGVRRPRRRTSPRRTSRRASAATC